MKDEVGSLSALCCVVDAMFCGGGGVVVMQSWCASSRKWFQNEWTACDFTRVGSLLCIHYETITKP